MNFWKRKEVSFQRQLFISSEMFPNIKSHISPWSVELKNRGSQQHIPMEGVGKCQLGGAETDLQESCMLLKATMLRRGQTNVKLGLEGYRGVAKGQLLRL